jgi:hypothetical protein
MILATHVERLVGPHDVAGLGDALLAGEHDAGEDERLGARAGFGEAAFDEGDVGALSG